MTLAVADPTATQQNVPQTVPIVVLGTDALLAAAPATPVQLAHACLRAGFANVVPASSGDEILAAAVLWNESGSRTLVEIDGEDFATEIAQHLLSGKNILIDAAARLGCVCSGATAGSPAKHARQKVIALEPPRATIPVVDEQAP